ncbi:hypothetical protein Bbelb_063100 [Branchiostoma belcheri]|nr:hypothetical protein Bbelb_063100 [Branchiostoma belcheri]
MAELSLGTFSDETIRACVVRNSEQSLTSINVGSCGVTTECSTKRTTEFSRTFKDCPYALDRQVKLNDTGDCYRKRTAFTYKPELTPFTYKPDFTTHAIVTGGSVVVHNPPLKSDLKL